MVRNQEEQEVNPMAHTLKASLMYFTSLFLALFLVALPAPKVYSATCEQGTGMPPFLGEQNIDPNVLLMIDNSASMLDLAAVGKTGICYDGPEEDANGVIAESYDNTKAYSGPFRPYRPLPYNDLEDVWYGYNLATGRFEKSTYWFNRTLLC